jgi:hypothetical protein
MISYGLQKAMALKIPTILDFLNAMFLVLKEDCYQVVS